jgi:hypothetical protein
VKQLRVKQMRVKQKASEKSTIAYRRFEFIPDSIDSAMFFEAASQADSPYQGGTWQNGARQSGKWGVLDGASLADASGYEE